MRRPVERQKGQPIHKSLRWQIISQVQSVVKTFDLPYLRYGALSRVERVALIHRRRLIGALLLQYYGFMA